MTLDSFSEDELTVVQTALEKYRDQMHLAGVPTPITDAVLRRVKAKAS